MIQQLISNIALGIQWSEIVLFLRQNDLIHTNSCKEDIISLTQKIWSENNLEIYYKPNEFNLPASKIMINNKQVVIHGLIHDSPPNIILSDVFKKNIADMLKNKSIICEDGFVDWIPNAESFNEIDYFQFGKLTSQKTLIKNKVPKYTLNLDIAELLSMNSISDFVSIRQKLLQFYLPEPLGINSHYFINDYKSIAESMVIPTITIKRYIYEARKILDFLPFVSDELHVVVGCRHERPLIYLLSNQYLVKKYFDLI